MSVLLSGISLVYHQCCSSEGKAFVFAWLEVGGLELELSSV